MLRKINAKNARPGDYIKLGSEYVEIAHVAKGFDGGYYAYTNENDTGYIIQDSEKELHYIFRKEGD